MSTVKHQIWTHCNALFRRHHWPKHLLRNLKLIPVTHLQCLRILRRKLDRSICGARLSDLQISYLFVLDSLLYLRGAIPYSWGLCERGFWSPIHHQKTIIIFAVSFQNKKFKVIVKFLIKEWHKFTTNIFFKNTFLDFLKFYYHATAYLCAVYDTT